MVSIKLTLRELNLLSKCYEDINNSSKKVLIDYDENEIEKIVDVVSDYFIKKGLRINDVPNSLGFELENLNDKFIEALQELKE